MGNRAWCALGSAAVLATAAGGCDRGANGHAHGQRVGALATAVVGDDGGDDSGSGFDAAEVPTGTPEAEAPEPEAETPEAESLPDAVAVDDAGSSGDESDQEDVGSPSPDDDSGSSSGGSGSGSSSGFIIIFIDSGSVAPPSQTMDASVESGDAPDSGNEAAGPTLPGGGPETGAPHRGGGFSLHVPLEGVTTPPGTGDDSEAPSSSGDDSGGFPGDDAAPPWGSGPSGDDGGSPNLDLPPTRAIIGCAGCTVPDAPDSGALAWLMVALTVGLRTLRRRR